MFQDHYLTNEFKFPFSVIGLTGAIGCGKSAALKIFSDLGCNTIESDKICHSLYEGESVNALNFRKNIISRWGKQILTRGSIDRRKIGKIVFSDKSELSYLNSITHPEVFDVALLNIREHKDTLTIFDIPLLFELGIEKSFHKTISIWTNQEEQIRRLRLRNWSDSEIAERTASQLSADAKLEKADYGLINTGTIDLLQTQCKKNLTKINKILTRKTQ